MKLDKTRMEEDRIYIVRNLLDDDMLDIVSCIRHTRLVVWGTVHRDLLPRRTDKQASIIYHGSVEKSEEYGHCFVTDTADDEIAERIRSGHMIPITFDFDELINE